MYKWKQVHIYTWLTISWDLSWQKRKKKLVVSWSNNLGFSKSLCVFFFLNLFPFLWYNHSIKLFVCALNSKWCKLVHCIKKEITTAYVGIIICSPKKRKEKKIRKLLSNCTSCKEYVCFEHALDAINIHHKMFWPNRK